MCALQRGYRVVIGAAARPAAGRRRASRRGRRRSAGSAVGEARGVAERGGILRTRRGAAQQHSRFGEEDAELGPHGTLYGGVPAGGVTPTLHQAVVARCTASRRRTGGYNVGVEIPRFAVNQFDVRIAGADAGEAFQTFAAEVLRFRYPRLHAYRARGRDGGIDLDAPSGIVLECKHCGTRDAQSAWNEVATTLDKHLSDPAGPGQSQYAPWYASNGDAITVYVFATNAEFANRSRKDELRNEIRTFFSTLARRSHLAHLRNLDVEVLDWSDFESELKAHPEMLFRWFPAARPAAFTLLDTIADGKLFRSFLSEATLPYYSRAAYLKAGVKPTASPLTEDDLLRKLDGATGLIITGKGGAGKTRLTLELGRRAREHGWLVMRASSSFSGADLDDLLVRLGEPRNVLLLVDYVETIASFADRVEHIDLLNATARHRIRYIANCRTSYYRNVQTIGGHERVDITPAGGAPAAWLDDYRRTVVERILLESGIAVTAEHRKVCRDIPVFAVFMTYLQRQKRTDDLHELVADGEFGTWIARRVQRNFDRAIAGELTTLLAMFPMDEPRRAALPPPTRELFERLVSDGWVEQLAGGPEAGQWVTAHDALADRVILNHLESLGPAAALFIRELLSFSETHDGIASALVSLQRLSDAPELQAIDWVGLFAERLNVGADGWRAVRPLILQNNLLTPAGRIELLEATRPCWEDLVGDRDFQSVMGWVCKQFSDAGDDRTLPIDALRAWVLRSAEQVQRDYLLARGLFLFPELRTAAERWLASHPVDFQTHFLLVSWLSNGHGPATVARHAAMWLEKFTVASRASFLYRAWLEAGGDRVLVEEPIRKWLEQHGESEQADFVYRAWLDADGDRVLVEEPIRKWVEQHGESEDAKFVYRAWLDAGGDRVVVEEAIRRWLEQHGESKDAQFVYRAWLDAGGDRVLVEEPIRKWVEQHGESKDAKFVFRAWLNAGGDRVVVEEAIRRWIEQHGGSEDAQFVYSAWLDAGGDRVVVEEAIRRWIEHHGESEDAQFVYRAWLDAGSDRVVVEEAIREWVERHGESEQADFIYRAWLDAGGDRVVIEEPIRKWLERHTGADGADFLVVAYLKRGGDFERVREAAMAAMRRLRESPDGSFISKVLARQPDLPDDSVLDILAWCRRYSENDDALWRLSQLGEKIARSTVAADACVVCETVLKRWLEPASSPAPTIATMVTGVLVAIGTFRDWQLRGCAYAMLVRWLRHPAGLDVARIADPDTVPRLITLVGVLLKRRDLDLHADADVLARVTGWAERCAPATLSRFGTLAEWFATRAS